MTTLAKAPKNKIKDLRTRAALTQADLAKEAGIHISTLILIERGASRPQPATSRKLAAALGVSTWDLFE